MASVNDLKSSKFLKQEDVGTGVLATIRSLEKVNVAMEGVEPDMKFALHFDELEKPLVLNSTNGQIIAEFTGISENIEVGWVDKQVVLYAEANVFYAGKRTGGIRVRKPNIPDSEPKKPPLPF